MSMALRVAAGTWPCSHWRSHVRLYGHQYPDEFLACEGIVAKALAEAAAAAAAAAEAAVERQAAGAARVAAAAAAKAGQAGQ